jgi:hypothetical protein
MTLDGWPLDVREKLLGEVLRLLEASRPFRRRAMWPWAVVQLRDDPAERAVSSRADFGQWLASNDLKEQATACIRWKVPPGAVLLWIESERPELVGAGFEMLRIDDEIHALHAEQRRAKGAA